MRHPKFKFFHILIVLLTLSIFITSCQPKTPIVLTDITKVSTQTPQDSQTAITDTPSQVQASEIEEILQPLRSLPINQFFEDSFFQLSLRYPESLAELGIEHTMGIEEPLLNNESQEYLLQTMELEKGLLEILQSYDQSSFSNEEKTSYDIYEWYLNDLVSGHNFANFQYTASYFILNSIHNQTFSFFTQNHPINNLHEAEDYVARLWLIEKKFDQIIEGLRVREKEGIIQPKFSFQWALYNLNNHTGSSAKSTPYYTHFEEALESLALTDEQKNNLLDEAEEAIKFSVFPGYESLKTELSYLESIAPTNVGLWQYEGGADYYAYLLKHYTTTNLSADEIHQLGYQELDRIHAQMRLEFDKLGYPQDEDLHTLFQVVSKDGGTIASNDAVQFYEELINQAYFNLTSAFDIVPKAKVIVVGGPTGGYYIQGSLDGTRPGAFYAAIQGQGQPYYQMPSLTYHEAIPGHHFQIALAQEMTLPTFRNHVSFTAYVEGWALYAERLAYDLGWYQNDPYANLGRLQFEALRAARLVVDTGIHAKQWSYQEAVDFMIENVGWSRQECENQIARYSILPGQATAYMIGMLKILELRAEAEKTFGDQFELSEFHNQILSGGSMPLSLLEENFQNFISNQ